MILIKVIIGIAVAVLGARIGLRRLLYITIACIAGFAAVSTVKGLHQKITPIFEHFGINHLNSLIITVILLTLIPIVGLLTFGRRLMVKFAFVESISETIDSILGGGYATTIYMIVLVVT